MSHPQAMNPQEAADLIYEMCQKEGKVDPEDEIHVNGVEDKGLFFVIMTKKFGIYRAEHSGWNMLEYSVSQLQKKDPENEDYKKVLALPVCEMEMDQNAQDKEECPSECPSDHEHEAEETQEENTIRDGDERDSEWDSKYPSECPSNHLDNAQEAEETQDGDDDDEDERDPDWDSRCSSGCLSDHANVMCFYGTDFIVDVYQFQDNLYISAKRCNHEQ